MAPFEGQTTKQDSQLLRMETIEVFSAPRHWQAFGFVHNAARVEFADGSIASDSHLKDLANVLEIEFRQCDFIQSPYHLARCRTLRFISCDALGDLSVLTNVKDLDISGSRLVENLDKLKYVRSITTGSSYSLPLPQTSLSIATSAACIPWTKMNSGIETLQIKQCHTLPKQIPIQIENVRLSSCEQLETVGCFHRASYMELVRTRLLDIETLRGFTLLQSIRFQASTCLSNVSALQHIPEVSLSLCVNLQDVTPLSFANTVEISCCPQISSVEALKYVPNLSISRCADLEDLAGLTQNHVVRISECYQVTRIGSLRQNCHTIDISRCFRVQDANLLCVGQPHTVILNGCNIGQGQATGWLNHKTLHTLNLSNNWDIVDASPFSHIHTLNLNRTSISDVSPLRNIHTLSLSGCELIEDVSSLGQIHTLDLSYCSSIRDVSALSFVHKLNLAGTLIELVGNLSTVHDLNLSGCPCIPDDQVNQLQYCHTIQLMGCSQLTRVDGLRHVHTLNLANCIGLTDISMLGHVHTLDITGCTNVICPK